jgi:hypothetical protein
VGADVRERGARSDQAGRRSVQAGGLQGVLWARDHARRAVECHVAYCCHQWLRETVSEPHQGADDRHDVADGRRDHQQPDDDANDQPHHADPDTDHGVSDTHTNTDHTHSDTHTDHADTHTDTDDTHAHAHAYDQQRTAADDACDVITWNYLSAPGREHPPAATRTQGGPRGRTR